MSGGSGVRGSSGGIGGATGSWTGGSLARQASALAEFKRCMVVSQAARDKVPDWNAARRTRFTPAA